MLERMMVGPAGPACDVCTIGAEADANGRIAARSDFGVGPRLALVTCAAAVAAVLFSGPIAAIAEPLWAAPATGAAGGLAALSLVWGLWAVSTGGSGRLVPDTAWPMAVRVSGAVAAAAGLAAGLCAVALAASPYVAYAF